MNELRRSLSLSLLLRLVLKTHKRTTTTTTTTTETLTLFLSSSSCEYSSRHQIIITSSSSSKKMTHQTTENRGGRAESQLVHHQQQQKRHFYTHLCAGAFAGTMEHTVMFPVDTIKTRMQLAIVGGGSAATTTTTTSVGGGGGANININNNAMVKSTIRRAITSILKTDGVKGLYRGVVAGGLGAGPAHAMYFATYEYGKKMFRWNTVTTAGKEGDDIDENERPKWSAYGEFIADASAGVLATIVGDAVQTPLDTIKQRMQMQLGGNCPSEVKVMSGEGIGGGVGNVKTSLTNNNYNNNAAKTSTRRFTTAFDAARTIVRNEGAHVLYRSYPTTLIMNVPFTAIHVGLYESTKRALKIEDEDEGFRTQFLAGGFAGGMAGFLTTPMDVVKTRMQTHCEVALGCEVSKTVETATASQTCAIRGDPKLCVSTPGVTATPSSSASATPATPTSSRSIYASANAFKVAKHVAGREGLRALFSGATARLLFHIPASAICWTTYEFMKRNLGIEVDPEHML